MADGGGALRRVLLAGAAYTLLAVLVGLPLVGVMRRAFLLPPVFEPMARGLLVAVGVVVLLAAWRYPQMGDRTGPPGEGGGPGTRRGPPGGGASGR